MRSYCKQRRNLIRMLVAAATALLSLSPSAAAPEGQPGDAWFRDGKFGLFIHWGLYAQLGEGEWVQRTKEIPVADYEKLRLTFNPTKFDARAWVNLAKAAGVQYITVTTKHHDGFVLFDSALTDYDIMSTPYKRDVIAELAAEAKKQSLKMCYYYSILDWHHPDYVPKQPWLKHPVKEGNIDRYMEYLRGHMRELLERDPQAGAIWFDGSWDHKPDALRSADLLGMIKGLRPGIMVNNRAGIPADFSTPEQYIPPTGLKDAGGRPLRWENCLTMTSHWWGYDKFEPNYKPVDQLIRTLVDVVSKGGNLLLNVGPRPDGTIQPEFVDRLYGIGRWLSINGEAIYGTTASPFARLPFYGRCTAKPGVLYFHLFTWPGDRTLKILGMKNRVKAAYLLADREVPVAFRQMVGEGSDGAVLYLPENAPDPVASVVAVEIEGEPQVTPLELTANQFGRIDLPIYGAELRGRHGQKMRLNVSGRSTFVDSWINPSDFLYWDFTAPEPGEYKVSLTYSCPDGDAGGEYGIAAASGRAATGRPGWTGSNVRNVAVQVTGVVQGTGAPAVFKTFEAGKVRLEKGSNSLTIRALSIPQGSLMKLSGVRLTAEPPK